MLLDRLNSDLKDAMKARDALKVAVLRLTLSEVKNARIEKGKDETMTDDDVTVVLRKAVKKREEAVETYAGAGRDDLARKEEQEAGILRAYLPQLLSGADLEAAVRAAVEETNANSVKDLGKVMKAVMAAHAGRVDGKEVQALARALLESGS